MLSSLQQMLAFDCDIVGTVDNGGALLDSAGRLQPDVVIADLNMPTVDGFEVCRQLTQSSPGMKVILLSGMDDTHIAEHALAVGAAAFLVKYTIARGQLMDTIRRVCAR
jgi:DNA-binding NarL/FixJ family response regulator